MLEISETRILSKEVYDAAATVLRAGNTCSLAAGVCKARRVGLM